MVRYGLKEDSIYRRTVHVDVKKADGIIEQRIINVEYKANSSKNTGSTNFADLDARLKELVRESGIGPYNNERV